MPRIAIVCTAALIAGTASVVAPAMAQSGQPTPIAVRADATFRHANSGIALPAMLDGLPRTRLLELAAPQLDVLAEYSHDDSSVLTIYVYLAGPGSLPVWFDRAQAMIESRPVYGTAALAAPIAGTPRPDGKVASGLIAAWALSGSAYRSTGVVLVPIDRWMVKVRYSSKSDDAQTTLVKLRRTLNAIGWPKVRQAEIAAQPVTACPDAIAFAGRAKSVADDGANTLLSALVGSIVESRAVKGKSVPVTWCRDPMKLDAAGLYRANGAKDAYLLALGDAATGVNAYPSVASQIMAQSKQGEGSKTDWAVELSAPGRKISFPSQDRLPDPARVMELLKGPAQASVSTWGKQTINLPADFGQKR